MDRQQPGTTPLIVNGGMYRTTEDLSATNLFFRLGDNASKVYTARWDLGMQCYKGFEVPVWRFWGELPIFTPSRMDDLGLDPRWIFNFGDRRFRSPHPAGPKAFGRIQQNSGIRLDTVQFMFIDWQETEPLVHTPSRFEVVTNPNQLIDHLPVVVQVA